MMFEPGWPFTRFALPGALSPNDYIVRFRITWCHIIRSLVIQAGCLAASFRPGPRPPSRSSRRNASRREKSSCEWRVEWHGCSKDRIGAVEQSHGHGAPFCVAHFAALAASGFCIVGVKGSRCGFEKKPHIQLFENL